MNLEWYFLPLLLVIIALAATSTRDIGLLTFGPLLLLAYWLIEKAFGVGKDGW
jgi:hypothetical protein